MATNDDIQLIEDYIDGILQGKELDAFKKRLQTDSAFAHEYKLRKKLVELWKDADDYQKTKSLVNEIISAEKRSGTFGSNKMYYVLAVAASIILLVGVYLILHQNNKLPWSQKEQMAKTDTLIKFQQAKPENYANIKYKVDLLSPVNNQHFDLGDTIKFSWTVPVEYGEAELFILDNTNDKIIFQHPVSVSDSQLSLFSGNLGIGKFTWYVQDTSYMEFFTIDQNK